MSADENSREFVLLESGLSAEFIRLGVGESDLDRLSSGLLKVGVMQQRESLKWLKDLSAWRRGGGETFIADSVIVVTDPRSQKTEELLTQERHVIGKALVPFGSPPEIAMATWLRRRDLLLALNVPAPQLFGAIGGTIYEEFIDLELSLEAFQIPVILKELGRIAAILDQAGFTTLSFLSDIRRRNTRLYYVDFGFDLGEPSGSACSSAKSQLESQLPNASKDIAIDSYNLHFCNLP